MIYIVQVFPYRTNNGCSVRVGKGFDCTEILEPEQCKIYEFVETPQEVKEMIKIINRLPDYYRNKDESVEKLKEYLQKAIIRSFN